MFIPVIVLPILATLVWVYLIVAAEDTHSLGIFAAWMFSPIPLIAWLLYLVCR